MDTDGPNQHSERSPTDRLRARLDPVWSRIRSRFTVDTRSLAAMRIALGLTLLIDLLYRAGSMAQFYTDSGVYPLSVYEATYSQFTGLSIHALSGDLWFQQLLFVVAGLLAVAFILGYRTRLVGVLSLILLFSLHARNPGVLNGGDRLLRVILFVALTTPLGERWSVDALRRGSARSAVASFGTAAVLLQPLIVFVSNAILKHQGETWYAGEALEIALKNDVMTILLGDVLASYPTVMTVLNYGWITLLSGAVLFLLVPVGRLRALAALAYIGAFSGMIVTMSVGIFPLGLIASVLPFLTAPFWDLLSRRVPDRWRNRLPTVDDLGPVGRPPIERRLLDGLRARGHVFAASYAVSYARSLVTVIGLLVVVWMLMFGAADVSDYSVPEEIDSATVDQQSWGLYAPDPSESYSWYVVEAQLSNGTVTADLPGTADTFEHPPDAAGSYETFRHRKYMQKVQDSGEDDTGDEIAEAYADWACGQVATAHDRPVDQLTVSRIYQPSPLDGSYDAARPITVIEWECQAR
jgi:hypothetical protein